MTTVIQETPLLLTERQASELLNCCERTVARMRQAGEIPVVKLRGAIRYSREDLLNYIKAESKTVSAEDSPEMDNAPRS
ncbi:helix-turn-helix domain-containing protein [Gimesia maris]|uniref:helix-turn-helix domain-containing protein n=1 Tax=Gimesia maris TaxID=122 RepID=UPI003C6D3707|tara:strand:- start:294 stop:530 length:237 start_codon:yes stop_codon:yes gene_type:complete